MIGEIRARTDEPIRYVSNSHHHTDHVFGNVEFLARTQDTPRFTFGIIEFQANRTLEPHVHGQIVRRRPT